MKLLPKTVVGDRSFALAVKIIGVSRRLARIEREFELARQLLRSGTSIGANITEAQGGLSKADFSAKISIAYKEALETKYWLNLLHQTDLLTDEEFYPLLYDTDDIARMLFKILKKTGRVRDPYDSGAEEDPAQYLNQIDLLLSDQDLEYPPDPDQQ